MNPALEKLRPAFTRAQLRALATVLRVLGPETRKAFDDGRRHRALIRAQEAIEDALSGAHPDPFDRDVEQFADLFADLRSEEFCELIRSRLRDLLSVVILWHSLEALSGVAGSGAVGDLLGVPQIDDPSWRASVVDLLLDQGVEVKLPGDPHLRVL